MTKEELRAQIQIAVRTYHQAFIEALPREVTMIQIETTAPDRHASNAHLVDFLRAHPLNVPMSRRVELALARWPTTSLIGLLEAMPTALEACEEARAEADAEVETLSERVTGLKLEVYDLGMRVARAEAKKTKARKAR